VRPQEGEEGTRGRGWCRGEMGKGWVKKERMNEGTDGGEKGWGKQ